MHDHPALHAIVHGFAPMKALHGVFSLVRLAVPQTNTQRTR